MKTSHLSINGARPRCFSLNTLIVGSGTAALNAAIQLHDRGQTDIAIATDHWGGGTSNNTGSDKQTYYKLSLAGDRPDSPLDMARDLFAGGGMHGDIALCEAVNSVPAFFNLVGLGVPFPHDRFGAYTGYQTDFDPRLRATSAGPLTSHMMFDALAGAVVRRGIRVFDRLQVVALLTDEPAGEKQVIGALAFDTRSSDSKEPELVVFNAVNLVLGTGGPAGIYRTSVYPESQLGATGMALAAGAAAHNLTESQFGLASIKFRWNLSGSYQQVLPRYFSTDRSGSDRRQFLNAYFPDMPSLSAAVFLKGYQWPFDPGKVLDCGSSLIDILVYRETVMQGRRVFLDFTRNPSGENRLEDFSLERIGPDARAYLEKSGALFGTPIERLNRINRPAVDLYLKNGIDLSVDPLEIAVCAQHNNGGLKADIWWESNLKHLFPVGEVNGSHGIHRPGGSALNSGQVGGLRAAQRIAALGRGDPPDDESFRARAEGQIHAILGSARRMLDGAGNGRKTLDAALFELQDRMTAAGAHIRRIDEVRAALDAAWNQLRRLQDGISGLKSRDLPAAFRCLDLCLTHAVFLECIQEYLNRGGGSRGSYLVPDPGGEPPCSGLDETWRFRMESKKDFTADRILEVVLDSSGHPHLTWVRVRPIPDEDTWFENVWKDFREGRIFS